MKLTGIVGWLKFTVMAGLLGAVSLVSGMQLEDDSPDNEVGLSSENAPLDIAKLVPLVETKVVQGEPVLDGNLEETFWNQALVFSIDYELFPVRLAAANVETHCRVAITESHVFVAFDATDPAIKELRTASRERDGIKTDDYVAIVIDPEGQGLRKYEFRVNPSGSISDVMQDTNSDRYVYDWDTEWRAAASIHEQGFRVEVAIPRPSTQLAGHEEDVRPVVMLKRHYPRRVDRTLASFFFLKLAPEQERVSSQAEQGTEADGAAPRLTVTPHLVYDRDEERDIGESVFDQVEETPKASVGGYARYQISEDRSLGLTINPNYAEIEADIARDSINNTFDPFQPEKRSLFIEMGEYFQTLTKTVYTRNVVQPSVGVDYLGKNEESSTALFAAHDLQTKLIMPDNLGSDTVSLVDSGQVVAANHERQFGRRSAGLLGTFRSGEDYHNAVISLNGTGNLGVDDKVRVQMQYSDTRYPERFANDLCNNEGCTSVVENSNCELGDCATTTYARRADFEDRLQGYNFQLNYKHDGPDSIYWARLYDVSPEFRADMGFIRRTDFRAVNLAYGRKWYFKTMKDDETLSRVRAYLVGGYMRSHSDNEDLETSGSAWVEYRGSYQALVRVGWWHRNRAVNRIDQSSLATGDNAPLFQERYWQWYSQVSPFASWTLHLDGRWGRTANPDNLVLGKMREFVPKLEFAKGIVSLMTSLTWRNYLYDGEQLYRERFISVTAMLHQSPRLSHRLLWLDDLTKRDLDRWRGDELARETEKTVEYTLIYRPDANWSILCGLKFEESYESDIDKESLTNREGYLKVERKFEFF